MNNKRSDGACNKPVSMPVTDAYRDNYDRIFNKIKDSVEAKQFLQQAGILDDESNVKEEYGGKEGCRCSSPETHCRKKK